MVMTDVYRIRQADGATLTSTQFLLFAFGVMMALGAAILERGVKLEEDVEGLV